MKDIYVLALKYSCMDSPLQFSVYLFIIIANIVTE